MGDAPVFLVVKIEETEEDYSGSESTENRIFEVLFLGSVCFFAFGDPLASSSESSFRLNYSSVSEDVEDLWLGRFLLLPFLIPYFTSSASRMSLAERRDSFLSLFGVGLPNYLLFFGLEQSERRLFNLYFCFLLTWFPFASPAFI